MSLIAIHADVTRWHWLRSSQFDLTFILGLPVLGIATGFHRHVAAGVVRPDPDR